MVITTTIDNISIWINPSCNVNNKEIIKIEIEEITVHKGMSAEPYFFCCDSMPPIQIVLNTKNKNIGINEGTAVTVPTNASSRPELIFGISYNDI